MLFNVKVFVLYHVVKMNLVVQRLLSLFVMPFPSFQKLVDGTKTTLVTNYFNYPRARMLRLFVNNC